MKKLILATCCTITLTACGNLNKRPIDPNGPNGDIRTLSANDISMTGTGDVAAAAVRACDNEGKKIEVITTTTKTGITGTVYPVIMFKCLDPDVKQKTKQK
jgi:hypothetical protein